MALITAGSTTLAPDVVSELSTQRESRSNVHVVLGRPDPDITLRPASLRTGRLQMVFADEAESLTAEQLHSSGVVLALASPERPSLDMSYIVTGRVERDQDTTRTAWTVTVEYQEVTP
jgi:hypothetical protein